jgi:hypothetical protein
MEECYCDGTTLQADANKYKVTWKKNVSAMKEKLTIDRVRVKVYEEKMDTCGTRSGYSTTDTDASSMRTKECSDDLRPSYNGMKVATWPKDISS